MATRGIPKALTCMHIERQAEFGLDSLTSRETRKLYFVLLRIVQEDGFMPDDDLDTHARRLQRIYFATALVYMRRGFSVEDLEADLNHLLDRLIGAAERDEFFEKAANLTRIRTRYEALRIARGIPELHLAEEW